MRDLQTSSPVVPRHPTPLRLAAILLLAGNVRSTALPSQLGRSVLDLPMSETLRLADLWRLRIHQCLSATPSVDEHKPDVRVLVGVADPLPRASASSDQIRFIAEQDSTDFRGTAGVLRDVGEAFHDEEFLLIGTASQCPDASVIEHLLTSAVPEAGATLSVGTDSTPTGLILVKCGALRSIPSVGFIDLKEQALARIAESSGVSVVETSQAVSRPIRDRAGYIAALRSWHKSGQLAGALDPFEERWKSAFVIIEEGASVADDARLQDSVVLSGGTVESGAIVVRSVVGPGGVVRRKQRALEQLVMAQGGGPIVNGSHRSSDETERGQ